MMNLAAIIGAGPVEPPAGQPDQRGASKDPSFDAHLDESLSLPNVREKEEEETDRADAAILLAVQQGFADWIAAQPGAADPDADGARHPESVAVPSEVIAAAPSAPTAAIEPGAGSGDAAASEATESIDIEVESAAPPARGIPGFIEAPVEQGSDASNAMPIDPALAAEVRAERDETAVGGDPTAFAAPDPAGRENPAPDVARRTTQRPVVAADRTGEPSSAPQVAQAAQLEELPKAVARTTERPPEREDPAEAPPARQDPPAAAAVQDLEVVRQTVVRLEGRRYHGAAPPGVETHAQPAIDVEAASTADQGRERPVPADVGSPTPRVSGGFEASTVTRVDEPSLPPARPSQPVPEAIAELVREVSGGEHAAATAMPQVPRAPQEIAPRLTIQTPVLAQPIAVVAEAAAAATIETPRAPLAPETADTIIQSLRMQYQLGGGDAVVHIKPEHLGPVSVSVRVENGVVSAVVNADNPAVVEWLKANEQLLRDGLASSGLHLERFAVRRDGQPPDDRGRHWRPAGEQVRRRRALQPESTFEITV